MARKKITKETREKVLEEFNHRCARCGVDHPHLHHIDEDRSNSIVENLIPLCPNCHLTDQHNPTRKIEIEKLQLFRRYKDPAILKPQFHPIFIRMKFINDVKKGSDKTHELDLATRELVSFIKMFEMGRFYSSKIEELIVSPSCV
jgi:hypothetical protein